MPIALPIPQAQVASLTIQAAKKGAGKLKILAVLIGACIGIYLLFKLIKSTASDAGSIFGQLGKGFGSAIGGIGGGLGDAIENIWDDVADIIDDALDRLGDYVEKAKDDLVPQWMTDFSPLSKEIRFLESLPLKLVLWLNPWSWFKGTPMVMSAQAASQFDVPVSKHPWVYQRVGRKMKLMPLEEEKKWVHIGRGFGPAPTASVTTTVPSTSDITSTGGASKPPLYV